MEENNSGKCIKVIDSIYLGDNKTSMDKALLQKNNIKYILSVGININSSFPDLFKYMQIEIDDSSTDILFHFKNTYE